MHLDEDWFKETRSLYLNVKPPGRVSHPCPICPVLKYFLTIISNYPSSSLLGWSWALLPHRLMILQPVVLGSLYQATWLTHDSQ